MVSSSAVANVTDATAVTDEARGTLVIGVGNDLRADDGAGRRVADAIEDLSLPDVEVRSQPQLTPELATLVAGRRVVVFVDADVDVDEVTVTPMVADRTARTIMAHHGHPGGILALVDTIGEQPDTAVLVSLPATDLSLDDQLSPTTARAVDDAITIVRRLATADGGVAATT